MIVLDPIWKEKKKSSTYMCTYSYLASSGSFAQADIDIGCIIVDIWYLILWLIPILIAVSFWILTSLKRDLQIRTEYGG